MGGERGQIHLKEAWVRCKVGRNIPNRGTAHAKALRQESTYIEATEKRLMSLEHSGGEGMWRQKKAGATLYRAFQILAKKVDLSSMQRKPLSHFQQGSDINSARYTFKTSL